jgi:hypothetical protein
MDKKTKKEGHKWFDNLISNAKQNIADAEEAKILLEEGKCHWRIHLQSLWASEGEPSLTYDAQPEDTLNKAAKDANEAFMAQNHRSDVQANRFAHLIFDNGQYVYMEHPDDKRRRLEKRKANSTREDRSDN